MELEVELHGTTYSTMMQFAQTHPDREIIGLLFGNKIEPNRLIMSEAYPFRVGGATGVEFQDEDYVKAVPIIQDCESRGLQWVGWFHSHPFRRGNHLYLSLTDIGHQYVQQQLNPDWIAIVINPYQINDRRTVKGMQAFQLKEKVCKREKKRIVTKSVKKLPLRLVNIN
jgi:proteasome lid subunit RPN8/RPN11